MSFLNPLFLLAAAAVAVPVLLHLFHRHETRRFVFPAIRYLLRTEREHARRIRLRQLLLLLARATVVLLLVAAGARLFLRGGGGAHEPTALAVVLDNSLSSGRVLGEERVLDVLLQRAREALAIAGPEDRIWVLRAGEPWDAAPPMDRTAALARVDSTEPSAAPADLVDAVARARALVGSSELPAAEIHVLSDLQRTGFDAEPGSSPPGGDLPIVVWSSPPAEAPNHWVEEVEVGGGLPPVAGQRTDIAVRLGAVRDADPGARPLPVRVVVGERIRAAGAGLPGHDVVLPLGPFSGGSVTGWVETDPDALRADDRRWFSFDVRPPVRVHRAGGASLFLDEGLRVLEDAGRVTTVSAEAPEVLLSLNGAGIEARRLVPAVVVPAPDETLLPALNRRLAAAGIPWRYGTPEGRGEAVVAESRIPVDLDGVRVPRHFVLAPTGELPPSVGTPVRLSGDDPLLLTGSVASGSYLLFAVPFDPAWTDLPVSAAMMPLLEWSLTHWARAPAGRRGVSAGEPIPAPPSATGVRDPLGEVHPVDGARLFRRTAHTGIYEIVAGDSVLDRVPVNPARRESLLIPTEPRDVARFLGPGTVSAGDPRAWRRAIFRSRRGPELWRPLLLAALGLLLFESWIASSGASPGKGRPGEGRRDTADATGAPGADGTPGRSRGARDRDRSARGGPHGPLRTADPGSSSTARPQRHSNADDSSVTRP